MRALRADELAELTGARLAAPPELEIRGAEVDSRRVRPGQLFAALRGEHADGHDYVAEAVAKGATAALVERPVPFPHLLVPDVRQALWRFARQRRRAYPGTVIAVTGSVGKTTTKELLTALLGGPSEAFCTPGNFNTEIGVPLALFDLADSHRFAVFELGMRGPGEIRALAGLVRPQVGVVTNVSMSHVGLLGSVERVAEAKAELLGALPAGGVAVLPAEDRWFPLLRLFAPRRVVTVASAPPADLAPDAVENLSLKGWRFSVRGVDFALPWPGRGALAAALLAVACAEVLGQSLATSARRLAALDRAPSRLRLVSAGGMEILDDTYNASPVSVEAALDLLATRPGRKVAVLGDMFELGEEAWRYHQEVGQLAGRVVDLLVAVGDLARAYLEGARQSGLEEERLVYFPSLPAAAADLPRLLRSGDAVLFKAAHGMHFAKLVAALQEGAGP
jgi:UDP-N-acetylmuramoyl-tripeptide--D-alanyl-D-alanine ligase